MKKLVGVVFLLAVCLVAASSARAQSQITTGTVQGEVVDEKGLSVPDATVVIKNLDTNFTKTATTGSDGRFQFLLLPSGRYTVTISKQGFATIVQENVNLTVGQAISLPVSMKISAVQERIVVTATPTIETAKTESSSTLNQLTVGTTPILGRKFEDLLTLTPGVSIVQGPDGDEINFNGQRGIFNNISLDGGDYNNGFFGEQMGGQRAAIDITLDAVKEFQVVAAGASAEFGRTAGGVVNVITKSGTNEVHGSLFHFQRLRALASNTSDGKPLENFSREQFGGTIGGPVVKDKMFFFAAFEQIFETLTRPNLSEQIGTTACPSTPTISPSNTAAVNQTNTDLINGNPDCQRVALLNFFRATRNQEEGDPVDHPIRNSAFLGRFDWSVTPNNQFSASFNFNRSKNINQTFDVPTYGNSANGIEGPSRIQAYRSNLVSTVSPTKLNEAHFTYAREARPRAAASSNVPADTGMGLDPTFRFGNPFFLQPTVDELIWRTQIRDNFSIVSGKHTLKFGGEWLHTNNGQVFRGFFTSRYVFDSVVGFLHFASPASSTVPGFGPLAVACVKGVAPSPIVVTYVNFFDSCPALFSPQFLNGPSGSQRAPLLFYLQGAGRTGPATDAAGASEIANQDFALFIQDKWQIWPNFTLNYGLRWEAQIFPDPTASPSDTVYGKFLGNPLFPSDGTLHNQKKMFQPRVGLAWDLLNNKKSVLRASWGIYNARQNMLTQVGSITTNGVQQQSIFISSSFIGFLPEAPKWPGGVTPAAQSCPNPPAPPNPFPCFSGVRVFSRDYANPRIYTTNVAFEQELIHDWALYLDFTLSKGVHLTRFIDANNGGPPAVIPPGANTNTVSYTGASPFQPELFNLFVTASSAKSLYRGFTVGMRKRFSQRFQLEGNYVYSRDRDDDSNERDPFTDRSFNRFDFSTDYANSDRDIRHKFNFYTYMELPAGIQANVRIQARSAQPITVDTTGNGSGAACSQSNSQTRVVNGTDCGRNHLRKNNEYFSFDWRVLRPFKFGERFALIPMIEMFNTFNNDNNVNPLISPARDNFDGFLRQGVGDPRQVQLAIKFTF